MGEKISTISHLSINKVAVELELNHSSCGSPERDIHLQTDVFRLELKESEFLELASAIILAAKKLRFLKNYN